MEYVRTVIRNRDGDTGSLYRKIWVVLLIYLAFAAALTYFGVGKHTGPSLSLATVVKSSGQYGLNQAMGIVTDRNGQIYIADSGFNRVVVLNAYGAIMKIIGPEEKTAPAAQKLRSPRCLALDKQKLFVGSYGNDRIVVYDTSGKLLDVLPHQKDRLSVPGIKALAMTTDLSGNLYVSDAVRQQIIVFDNQGNLRLAFGKPGYLAGELSFVNGIVVDDTNRRIIVLDSNNLRLVFFNFEGKYLSGLALNKTRADLFVAPRGLAYNSVNKLFYVTETLLDKVVALDEKGNVVALTKDIPLSYPHGITMGPDNLLYVTNRESKEIIVLNP